ncbi:MAG: tRNA 2-thiocytidine biosynthesis protein TtcA [Clostridia bacterium]|nr:tRNA 2-thiocytidine biosynthesis protein TtcA [Clostridia bacterium]
MSGHPETIKIEPPAEKAVREYIDAARDKTAEVENALRKRRRFRDGLFNRFAKAVVTYELVCPGDKIAVCISGGKDSMLMAKLFQELLRHRKFPFELEFLCMDPGYNTLNRELIEANAKALGIPITVFETRIFDAVDKVDKNPCYLCARMRRGWLYKKAQELGCNKIALGHHYDDVIETTLMSMLWGGQMQTMMPKLRSTNYPGMELIRPMYLIREDEIKAWRDWHGLMFLQCACHFTEKTEQDAPDAESGSKRLETKKLIRELKQTNPNVEANIFNSAHNVMLDALIAYKTGGEEHSFLDKY